MLDRRRLLEILALGGGAALLPRAGRAGDIPFADWLAGFRRDAAAEGISRRTLDAALTGLQPVQRVLELDQSQPESTLTWAEYIDKVVNEKRVQNGRRRLAENRALLQEIGAAYNVQPRFIVALWGVETDYGAFTGGFSVVAALATLAWSSSRPKLFHDELLAALKIIDQHHVRPEEMKGSWAGAMGQTQFMPSSYLRYAVDYSRSGRADIWTDRADVFASIANYLKHEGWDGAFTWGREVRLPPGFDRNLLGDKVLKPVAQWATLGVRRRDGGPLPAAALQAGLIQPAGADGPSLMVYGNYRVIMKWNRSTYFATSVSYLADRIES